MTYFRLQYIVLIGILIFFFFQNIWGVRFTTSDDSHHLLWAQHELSEQFKIIDNIAKSQARLYFYYHIWHLIFIQTFWDTIFYDILQTGTHLLSIILITYVLYLYTNNKHYLLYPLIYITTTPILWDHTLTTSVPLYHFTYLINLCLIFILIYKYKENPSKIKLLSIYFLFLFSIIGQEYQLFVSYFSVLLSIYILKDKTNNYKLLYPPTFISLAYFITIILFYLHFKPGYDGAVINLSEFDIKNFLGIIYEWSLSGNILFELFDDYTILPDLNYDASFSDNIPILSQISIKSTSLLFVVVIYFLIKSIDTWTNPNFRTKKEQAAICIFFIFIIVIPQFFLALTPKYRYWYSIGVLSYTYSSLSNFAICALINKMFSSVLNKYNYIAKTSLFIFFSSVFLINNAFNEYTSNAMKESSSKWIAWDIFRKSPYSSLEKNIRAPRFGYRVWHTPNHESYWNAVTGTLYGSHNKLFIENNTLSTDSNTFIDYYKLNNDIIVLYGELLNDEYINNPVLIKKGNTEYNYEYINYNGGIVRDKLNLKNISSNIYEHKIQDRIRFNSLRFSDKHLDGYVYAINNLLNIGQEIAFTKSTSKRYFQGNEWSNAEGDFIWGYGENNSLSFSIRETAACLPALEFTIAPIQIKEGSKIEIIFNNKLIKEFKPTLDINTYYSDLDKNIFNRNNTLVFRNNFFISPKSLNGSNDIRPLSIRFYKFKIFCR